MGYTFDGASKRIILDSTAAVDVQDLFSRWKDWVLLSDNSKWAPAFRSVAGDPIGGGTNIAPYFFLNTTDGWRIRPHEVDHELRLTGNLYSEDPLLTMFAPTLGDFTVTVVVERSASAQTVSVGSGLSSEQATQLRKLFLLAGLDPTKPLVVDNVGGTRRVPADGSEIDQVATEVTGVLTITHQ